MHDIQAEVIDTKTALNELYNDLFLSYSNSADSSYVNGVKSIGTTRGAIHLHPMALHIAQQKILCRQAVLIWFLVSTETWVDSWLVAHIA